MLRLPLVALLCVLTLAAAAAACGDGSSPDESTPDAGAATASPPATPEAGEPQSTVVMFDLRGEPRAEHFVAPDGLVSARWADDGSRIALYNHHGNTYVVFDITTGQTLTVFEKPEGLTPSLASLRSGARVVVSTRTGNLWLHDLDDGGESEFPAPDGEANNLAFSHDGLSMVFNHLTADGNTVTIANADGTEARPLREVDGVAIVREGAWSPDGLILLAELRDGAGYYVIVDRDGNMVTEIATETEDSVVLVQWAGAGRLLAVELARNGTGDRARFVDVASGEERDAPQELANPYVWLSPDGGHAVVLAARMCALIRVDADGGTVEQLASVPTEPRDPEPGFCATVDWTPDGTRAIVSADAAS